jgi:glutamate-1-semialdehyde 2,1-aminomutase
LGHAHPEVVEAVKAAAEGGTSFGAPIPQEVELAELVCQAFPSIEMVRLVNSGTEACMSAIRLARAYTGRSKFIKFSGCYHGHADGLLVRAGSGALAQGIPTSAGVPEAYAGETLVADYNDIGSVERYFESYPGGIAGVIVEPVAGNMGVVPPLPGFLEGLRRITRDNGALLIFDEVITGFRVAYGGAQALFGLTADITCLGKIIGGGLPVGAYGGRREVMEMVAPLGPMYQAGTLSGNPLAVSAGLATLKALERPGVYDRLDGMASRLVEGISQAAQEAERPVTINRVGSMFTSFCTPGPVQTLEQAEGSDTRRYAQFFHGMLERGIYLAPSQYEAGFVSLAHSDEDIDRTIAAAGDVMRALP